MQDLYRIGIVGATGDDRRYVSRVESSSLIELSPVEQALHWPQGVAQVLADAMNSELERSGRKYRLEPQNASATVKYTAWAETNVYGSRVETEFEVSADATAEQIQEEARIVIFDYLEWGYEKAEDQG
ncbi:MAG: hypothetical protein MJH10_09210 [Epibacterium sp.]|nr:hypothetical protein [Epibacterium sp.]NQX73713.1 hypothetical protein [Epibacterium sp.]